MRMIENMLPNDINQEEFVEKVYVCLRKFMEQVEMKYKAEERSLRVDFNVF